VVEEARAPRLGGAARRNDKDRLSPKGRGQVARVGGGAIALAAGLTTEASAAPLAHGQLVHIVKPGLRANASQSNNWFGYDQGTIEQGGLKQFHSISGDWTVPAASQHVAGQAEASSDWIGVGGGCVDAGCTVTDSTLIQAGTEQDVDASGKPSYLEDHARGPDAWRVVHDHGPLSVDPRDGGVDRGDAARDRHRRRPGVAADPVEDGVRLGYDERDAGRAPPV
jgi:peptidase A4-like protein